MMVAGWLGYGIGALLVGAGVTWRCRRCSCAPMIGMMAGMAMGMLQGLALGYAAGAATGSVFLGNAVGLILGAAFGITVGRLAGLLGVLDGGLAGVMGGAMGAMLVFMVGKGVEATATGALLAMVHLGGVAGILVLLRREASKRTESAVRRVSRLVEAS